MSDHIYDILHLIWYINLIVSESGRVMFSPKTKKLSLIAQINISHKNLL